MFFTDTFSSANTGAAIEPLLHQLFPQFAADDIELIHLAFRKLGHVSEYFVFGGLLCRALRNRHTSSGAFHRFSVSILITMVYAISDEWHQSFVPSRTASGVDVLIDTIGGICGHVVFLFARWPMPRS